MHHNNNSKYCSKQCSSCKKNNKQPQAIHLAIAEPESVEQHLTLIIQTYKQFGKQCSSCKTTITASGHTLQCTDIHVDGHVTHSRNNQSKCFSMTTPKIHGKHCSVVLVKKTTTNSPSNTFSCRKMKLGDSNL